MELNDQFTDVHGLTYKILDISVINNEKCYAVGSAEQGSMFWYTESQIQTRLVAGVWRRVGSPFKPLYECPSGNMLDIVWNPGRKEVELTVIPGEYSKEDGALPLSIDVDPDHIPLIIEHLLKVQKQSKA